MRIGILASAKRDLDEGYVFYESQEKGLGDYFISSVRADIEGFVFPAAFIESLTVIIIAYSAGYFLSPCFI